MRKPWQLKVTLTCSGQDYIANNPTSYHAIISDASTQRKGLTVVRLKPLAMSSETSQPLRTKMANAPVLTYIGDYGARMPLVFRREGSTRRVDEGQNNKGW